MRRLPARRFPVPPGITPSGTSVPTSAAAACMAVPSPPNTATMSTLLATPYSARSPAWPGPGGATTSTSQPPLLSVFATRSMLTLAVRAAAGLAMSNKRVTSELPFPFNVRADLIGVRGEYSKVLATGRQRRLHTGLQAPFPAESEFQTRAQIVVAELTEIFGTKPRVQSQEGLAAELPPRGQLRERLHPTAMGHTRSDFDQIERHAQILDQRALQLTRQGTGEVGQASLEVVGLPQAGSLVGGISGYQVRDQIGFRYRRIEGALQPHLGGVQRPGDVGNHRDFLTADGSNHVGCLDVQAGIQIAEVANGSSVHREVSGDRPDVKGVAAPQGVQGA